MARTIETARADRRFAMKERSIWRTSRGSCRGIEAGIAGTEIIDGRVTPRVFSCCGEEAARRIAHDGAFGQFDFKEFRRKCRVSRMRKSCWDELFVGKLQGRQIDRDEQVFAGGGASGRFLRRRCG